MSQPAVLQTDSKRWEFWDVNTEKPSCFLVTYHMPDGCFIHIPPCPPLQLSKRMIVLIFRTWEWAAGSSEKLSHLSKRHAAHSEQKAGLGFVPLFLWCLNLPSFFFLPSFFSFYWSIVYLRWFRCTVKWFNFIYIYQILSSESALLIVILEYFSKDPIGMALCIDISL